jgi:hypothetical protein
LTVVAHPVEEWVAEAVLYRLDTDEIADRLAGRRPNDERTALLADELSADETRLTELAEAYGAGQVTLTEWLTAKTPIEHRIHTAQGQLAAASGDRALQQLIGTGAQLRGQWSTLNLDRQAAIVRTVLDHAVIAPGTLGAREVDVDRIQPVWRL